MFRIAATFPLPEHGYKRYMISGDERFGFDPNAFVQKLIEETGISHVWEPVRFKQATGDGPTWALRLHPVHCQPTASIDVSIGAHIPPARL